jgi:hypothetical protein
MSGNGKLNTSSETPLIFIERGGKRKEKREKKKEKN